MLNPILVVSPDFSPVWNMLLSKRAGHKNSLPIYVALTELARHISQLHLNSRQEEARKIFDIIESWHLEGDAYVHEAATSGLIEDLQNSSIVGEGIPQQLASYLLPETRRWWEKSLNAWLKWK